MEACSKGSIKIAECLIRHNASVLQKDDQEWTAVDYLYDYSKSEQALSSNQNLHALKHFLKLLQEKQRKGKCLLESQLRNYPSTIFKNIYIDFFFANFPEDNFLRITNVICKFLG